MAKDFTIFAEFLLPSQRVRLLPILQAHHRVGADTNKSRSRSTMDSTLVSEAEGAGSIPAGTTNLSDLTLVSNLAASRLISTYWSAIYGPAVLPA